jgi:hypothetical protein
MARSRTSFETPRSLREKALLATLDIGEGNKAIADMLEHVRRRLAANHVHAREVHQLLREAQRMEDDQAIRPGFDSREAVAA